MEKIFKIAPTKDQNKEEKTITSKEADTKGRLVRLQFTIVRKMRILKRLKKLKLLRKYQSKRRKVIL